MSRENMMRLANVMGLDTAKAAHSLAIVDCLKEIKDFDRFLGFCRAKRSGVEYVTRTERLDVLQVKFLNILHEEALAKERDKAGSFAVELDKKVSMCRLFVQEKACGWAMVVVEGEKYFNPYELKSLKDIGSVSCVVDLCETHRLREQIARKYMQEVEKKLLKTNNAIASPRVMALLENSIGEKI